MDVKTVICNGFTHTYVGGLLESIDDKPSKYAAGHEEWHKRCVLHREGKPAIIINGVGRYFTDGKEDMTDPHNDLLVDGTIIKMYNGQIHSTDGPAIIYTNGTQIYYLNGKIHRNDGPAVILDNGTRKWYQYGKLHRSGNEPAVITHDGLRYYITFGKRYMLIAFDHTTYVSSGGKLYDIRCTIHINESGNSLPTITIYHGNDAWSTDKIDIQNMITLEYNDPVITLMGHCIRLTTTKFSFKMIKE